MLVFSHTITQMDGEIKWSLLLIKKQNIMTALTVFVSQVDLWEYLHSVIVHINLEKMGDYFIIIIFYCLEVFLKPFCYTFFCHSHRYIYY